MDHDYKILYAEDETTLKEITTELLKSEGYQVTAVNDGEAAMKAMEKENFDLLVSDFQMPKVDGALLLMWCRQNGRHMPVIFVSGNVERLPCESTALEDCCASLLHKPFSFSDLLKAIEKAKRRNHEFDCRGKVYNPRVDRKKMEFRGQHYYQSGSNQQA